MTAQRIEDDAPRGFVPMADYLRLQRKCDELAEQVACLKDEQRDGATDELAGKLHMFLPASPQCARILAFILTAKRKVHYVPDLQERFGLHSYNHVSVLMWRLNAEAMRLGGPRLIAGRKGSGGVTLQPGAREWIEHRLEGRT